MSEETKWTRGPWVVGQSAWDEFELCVDTGYGCEPTGMPSEICPIASSHHDGEWGEEDKANAHLIAAAPELYSELASADSQLEMAADAIEAGRIDEAILHCRSMVRPRRAALAKARGETL